MAITFREVTPENFRAVILLKVAPEQENFVATNLYSLAQAKVWTNFVPRAIYTDNTLVGFVMYSREGACYYISRLMLDTRYQRCGYGRAAMQQLIARFHADSACREVGLSYEPSNIAAARFYKSLGFVETGELDEGSIVARLPIVRDVPVDDV